MTKVPLPSISGNTNTLRGLHDDVRVNGAITSVLNERS